VVDVVLAAAVAAHMLTGPRHPVPAVATVVLAGVTLSLIWRRRAPFTVLAVNGAVFLACEASGYTPVRPLPVAVLIGLYTVAVHLSLPVSLGAGMALSLGAVAAAVAPPGALDDEFLDQLIAIVAAGTLGGGVRLNRIRTSLLEEKAAQLVREHAVHTRLAVEVERARIARELHDIVAHHVSVIVALAGASGRVFDTEPAHARTALRSVETIGREALTEMRRLLSVLRTEDHGANHAPQPGLSEMPALVAQVEQAQLPVELAVRGEPRRLSPGVELNAYRIVQESLTNTLKHAGPTRATVVVHYRADTLELRISDQGRGIAVAPPAMGHGLLGMRQRASLLGGKLTAGPGPLGGFQVTAVLPVEGGT
jgi:signal transduction histidine kinase